MPARRRITIRRIPATVPELSKSVELERRVASLEGHLEQLRETIEALTIRTVALRAQLDHLAALVGRE